MEKKCFNQRTGHLTSKPYYEFNSSSAVFDEQRPPIKRLLINDVTQNEHLLTPSPSDMPFLPLALMSHFASLCEIIYEWSQKSGLGAS